MTESSEMQDMQFDESEAGVADDMPPPQSPWSRRKSRSQKEKESKDANVLISACPVDLSRCLLCDKKCYCKSRFCADHKKDAEACKRDAEQSGNIAFFNEQAASTELFRKMLYEYITQCGSKGPGCKRDRFDWVTYQQRVYAQKQPTKGHKLKPMCYEKWMKHSQEEEFKSWYLG